MSRNDIFNLVKDVLGENKIANEFTDIVDDVVGKGKDILKESADQVNKEYAEKAKAEANKKSAKEKKKDDLDSSDEFEDVSSLEEEYDVKQEEKPTVADGVSYKCPNCGGNLEYNPKNENMKCPYCEYEEVIEISNEVQEYDFSEYKRREEKGNWTKGVELIHCDSCGAETVVSDDHLVVKCSFCGSANILVSKSKSGIAPEAVVTFTIDKHKAIDNLNSWIKGKGLAPKELKHLYSTDKLSAVYVPYWTFDTRASSSYTGKGGNVYYKTVNGKSERRVRWYSVSGNVEKNYDDFLVNASKNYNSRLLSKIEPFNTKEAKVYDPKFLSGCLAEKYSIDMVTSFETAKSKMHSELSAMADGEILSRYDQSSDLRVSSRFNDITYKHILLPVWSASFMFKGKNYTYLVNGQTGEVSGEYPKDPLKIALIVIGVIIAFVVYWMFLNN